MLKGLGLLVGMVIGAGMFALPYAVARAGIFWSTFHFILAAVLVTSVHLLYGGVLSRNHTRHRLPGYMRAYFGAGAYWIVLVTRLFAYFGYLLVYGALGGFFIEHFIPGLNPATLSVVFFLALAPLIFMKLSGASNINLFLTVPLVVFVGVLFFAFLPQIQYEPGLLLGDPADWFFPYGIFLFAFSGASIIPELVDLFGSNGRRRFYVTVLLGTLIVAIVYILFMVTVLGIARGNISEDGLSPVKEFGGQGLFLLGSLIGLLAVVTSYITLGIELRFTFQYDLGFSKKMAGIIVAFVPLVLYLFGINNFLLILGLTGAVGVGVEGVAILFLARRVLATPIIIVSTLTIAFLIGAVFEALGVFGLA